MSRFPPAELDSERLRLRLPTAADAPVVFELVHPSSSETPRDCLCYARVRE